MGLGAEVNSPLVNSEMVLSAASDDWLRYAVPNSNIILYDVNTEDIGKPYADGVDNDGDGAIDEGIDEGIDEMIDESRDDFIDNDADWEYSDDVGINGDGSGGLFAGAGDQRPTSGSGTGFPESGKTLVWRESFASSGYGPLADQWHSCFSWTSFL